MAAYMRDQFPFTASDFPVEKLWHRSGENTVSQQAVGPLARNAFHRPPPRIQYTVGDLLSRTRYSLPIPGTIESLFQCARDWDTVDWLAPNWQDGFWKNQNFIDQYLTNGSSHQTTGWCGCHPVSTRPQAQLDTERLAFYCLRHQDSTEFFIQKAMGWILRTHSRRVELGCHFVRTNPCQNSPSKKP